MPPEIGRGRQAGIMSICEHDRQSESRNIPWPETLLLVEGHQENSENT
jgi:hypothetical protein